MIYVWHISVVVIFYSFCEVLLLNYLDFFIYINLGKNYSNLFFSIILCIFVTALFSGYTDYFSLCEIFFFVFVCEYNHNFVSKTYFCELQLMKSLFTSLVKYCVSKVSAYKKKFISSEKQTNEGRVYHIILVILHLCEIGQPLCSYVYEVNI